MGPDGIGSRGEYNNSQQLWLYHPSYKNSQQLWLYHPSCSLLQQLSRGTSLEATSYQLLKGSKMSKENSLTVLGDITNTKLAEL